MIKVVVYLNKDNILYSFHLLPKEIENKIRIQLAI